MSLVQEIRRRGSFVVGPTIGALVVGYFVLNAFQGDRGILAWVQLHQNVVRAEAIHANTRVERQRLQHRTALLKPDNLDPDLLDERARIMAGLGRPDELVIFYPSDTIVRK
jgi:cell division protein FtsB